MKNSFTRLPKKKDPASLGYNLIETRSSLFIKVFLAFESCNHGDARS